VPYGSDFDAINVSALALDPTTSTLYRALRVEGVSGASSLIRIETASGGATFIDSVAPANDIVSGMSFDPDTNLLYGIVSPGCTICPETLNIISTGIGSSGIVAPLSPQLPGAGFSFNPDTDQAYANYGNVIFSLNIATGVATAVGTVPVNGLISIQFIK
jgi:hypothetical protein